MAHAFAATAHDLPTRALSSLVIVAGFALTLALDRWLFDGWVLAILLFGVGSIAAFEWSRLCRAHHMGFAIVIVLSLASVIMLFMLELPHLIIPTMGLWLLVQLTIRSIHRTERIVILMIGNVLLCSVVLCILFLETLSPDPLLMIWPLMVVIASDVSAYFVGRTVGGPRVAVRISPGKTWSGLVGAMIGGALVGALMSAMFSGNVLLALATGILLALVGQIGDFSVSWLKRQANVKDSGHIVPGHGGILDRFDSLLLALPVFVLVCQGLHIPPL